LRWRARRLSYRPRPVWCTTRGWVGRLPLSLGGGPRGVGRPVGSMYPRLPRGGDLLLVHAKTYAASGRRLLLATEE